MPHYFHKSRCEKQLRKKIQQVEVPLEQNPTFLGIRLDPKLAYTAHLQDVIKKQTSKINLIQDRSNQLFIKFMKTRAQHELIAKEIHDYLSKSPNESQQKFSTSSVLAEKKALCRSELPRGTIPSKLYIK
ncbi:hypothetical protein BpHYR1_028959 [Brachionus plicatilis]|uniref:RNA-directed DNA polymerase from mobile element jockey-like n=1 Tax=Brachionus plicatilis TaxID=10195 RepID=A0A3M7SGA7_BRAPC|nr:hypothetical protein BpHYR1_028959 [Brachionus plicatilis]